MGGWTNTEISFSINDGEELKKMNFTGGNLEKKKNENRRMEGKIRQ